MLFLRVFFSEKSPWLLKLSENVKEGSEKTIIMDIGDLSETDSIIIGLSKYYVGFFGKKIYTNMVWISQKFLSRKSPEMSNP